MNKDIDFMGSENQHVGAGLETLMKQAPMTAGYYLKECIERIDAELGDGYAEEHPDLIGTMLQACSADFNTGCTGIQMQLIAESLDRIVDSNE